MDVRNCKECGKLFNYAGVQVCPECRKKEDEKFAVVKEYLRRRPNVGVSELAEETETTIATLRRWVREERLILTEASSVGFDIFCESCKEPILSGRFCTKCKRKMAIEISGEKHATDGEEGKRIRQTNEKERMRFLDRNL